MFFGFVKRIGVRLNSYDRVSVITVAVGKDLVILFWHSNHNIFEWDGNRLSKPFFWGGDLAVICKPETVFGKTV